MQAKSCSIKDVAATAGVSIGTVSRVLNGKADVNPDCVQRVQSAIRKLNYTPNPLASGLARKSRGAAVLPATKTRTIGFILDSLNGEAFLRDEFEARFLAGAEAVASARQHNVLFSICGEAITRGDIPPPVRDRLVDGVILRSCSTLPDTWLEAIAATVPVVLLSNAYESDRMTLPSVMWDNAAGIRKVLRYLKSLEHRRIGFLMVHDTHMAPHCDHEQRHQAYLQGMTEFNLIRHPAYAQIPPRDWARQSLEDVVNQALDAWLALGKKRPSAICCAADVYALCLIREAARRGLRTPQDLSVTGIMNIAGAAVSDPPLTTVALPSDELGKAAAGLLLERIENPRAALRRVLVDGPLVERLSCAQVKRET